MPGELSGTLPRSEELIASAAPAIRHNWLDKSALRGKNRLPAGVRAFGGLRPMELERVRDYYEKTYWDYRVVWTGRDTLACHFGYYDDATQDHSAALIRANEQVATLAGIGPGARVLDAGCGLGGTALWLAGERRARVLGVSLSERQVARARRAALERGLADRVAFEVADFTAVPEPDGAFDAVIAIESLCHAADKAPFFAEAARLLRPGGRVVVSDFMRARATRGADEARAMREWCDGWAMSDLAAPEELVALATGAGLAEARALDVTANVTRSLRRLYKLTYIGWPLSTLFRLARLRNEHGHRNVIASRRQYETLCAGLWRYVHFSARKC